jgi:hypothetical protein
VPDAVVGREAEVARLDALLDAASAGHGLEPRPATGNHPVPVTLACRTAAGAATSCSAGPVSTSVMDPTQNLVSGRSYTVLVDPMTATSKILDQAGNPVPAVTRGFQVP